VPRVNHRAGSDVRMPGWLPTAAGAVIALAACVAYATSISAPFVFDDGPSIVGNLTIRHLWPLGPVFSPPAQASVCGRPLVNLSLALNYALGGLDVRGYHAANLLIHILAGITLFGIVRRTLGLKSGKRKAESGHAKSEIGKREGEIEKRKAEIGNRKLESDSEPTLFAFAVALIWTVHPLLTESVTCVVQRTESLMGLFYFVTIYCFLRGAESSAGEIGKRKAESGTEESGGVSPMRGAWFGLAVAACLLGMATKEVMATAPAVVFLYDRTFISGSFRDAWRRRRGLYLGLAATWIVLLVLLVGSGANRGGTSGFGTGVSAWSYALTQCEAIVWYLRLAAWPHPLVLDYGSRLATGLGEAWPQALLIGALLAATLVALRRKPALGFLGAWFFVILAPSSSVIPLASQTMAEHRMYLPLAAVVALATAILWRICGRPWIFLGLTLGLAGFACAATVRRNEAYSTEVGIWSDTVASWPGNPRAESDLGLALCKVGRIDEGIVHCKRALEIDPAFIDAHNNLAFAYLQQGRMEEAAGELRAILAKHPDFVEAHANLGLILSRTGHLPEAVSEYEAALRLQPANPGMHFNLGTVLMESGRLPDAAAQYGEALRLNPDYAEARRNLEAVRGRMR